MTLKEQLEELEKLNRALAIWEAIYRLVDDKFISKDGRKVSGIRVPNTEDLIPEEEIEDILQSMGDGPITDLKNKIDEIESRQVIVIQSNKVQNEKD